MEGPVIICGGYDICVRFWQARQAEVFKVLPHSDSHVNCLEISPDYASIAVGGNPLVRFYDLNTAGPRNSQPILTFDGHSANVTAIGYETWGRWFFTASEDGSVKVWDIRASGNQIGVDNQRVAVHTASLLNRQSELAFADGRGSLQVWDLIANKISQTVTPVEGVGIKTIAVSPIGQIIVAANHNGTIFTWSYSGSEFEQLTRFNSHNGHYVLQSRFSTSSQHLALTSSDGTCSLWNHREGHLTLERSLQKHKGWVWDCIFSSDGLYILTASSDKTAKLWEVNSGKQIVEYAGSERGIIALALLDVEKRDVVVD